MQRSEASSPEPTRRRARRHRRRHQFDAPESTTVRQRGGRGQRCSSKGDAGTKIRRLWRATVPRAPAYRIACSER
eukprot:6181135-Pleurochrysis_carterae.AAC.1